MLVNPAVFSGTPRTHAIRAHNLSMALFVDVDGTIQAHWGLCLG